MTDFCCIGVYTAIYLWFWSIPLSIYATTALADANNEYITTIAWILPFVLLLISLCIIPAIWSEDGSCCCGEKCEKWSELRSKAMEDNFEEQEWFVSFLIYNLILSTYRNP